MDNPIYKYCITIIISVKNIWWKLDIQQVT